MPKEDIYCEPKYLVTGDDSTAQLVEVGWGKAEASPGAHVTIAAYDKLTHSPHGSSDDCDAGLMVTMVPLGREGVNRLIRTLRKARDQAFGVDA